MNEEGHFVLEALVGLMIAAILLVGAQQLVMAGLRHQSRAATAMEEAQFYEAAQACVPRLMTEPQWAAFVGRSNEERAQCAGLLISAAPRDPSSAVPVAVKITANRGGYSTDIQVLVLQE